jgi:hypothetical protein
MSYRRVGGREVRAEDAGDRLRLVLPGGEQPHLAGRADRRQRQRDTHGRRLGGALYSDDRAFLFPHRGMAGEEGRHMGVGPDAQQQHVEGGYRRKVRRL